MRIVRIYNKTSPILGQGKRMNILFILGGSAALVAGAALWAFRK